MNAAASWDDILVRDNFQDTGQTPTADPVWESPDIIPFGSDILDFDLLESSYNGPDLGLRHPIVQGQLNRIYVRGKNLRTGCPTSGDVRLYFAPGGLLLDPRAWTPIAAEGGGTSVPFTVRGGSREIPPGRICVSRSAFLFPSDTPPGHYCTITTVDTPAHPVSATLPTFSSLADYLNWVRYNPNVGWRNIDVIPCRRTNYVLANLAICNLNNTPTRFVFGISGTDLPSGTATFSNTDQKAPFSLTAQIYSPGTDEGYTRSILLPADYSGTVTVVVQLDQPLPCDARIVLRAYNPVTNNAGALERRLAVPLTGVPELADALFLELGAYTFVAADTGS
ncbi:hypothetical protein [Kitasatospora sp. CB02891]|uniref:hypothetical protein n=1 Tax=Kitasatospora sp. CB02891 TaxID=2020329 RepID=UPI000C27DF0A|nr:hypothetical protein [Kitasatospora sp. CB02891]PJN23751.1 hypothetical protein CG736_21005 [Kitasatospora sp. CB02891]